MTTDKQVADSLTTQGKTISQEEAPPQTIIRDCETPCVGFNKVLNYGSAPIISPEEGRVYDASWGKLGPKSDMYVDGGAEWIIPLLDDQIDDIAGTFYGDGISIVDRQFARKIEAAHGIRDVERQQLVNAEVRRQTVQAEAMVNLAVGVVAAKMSTHGFKFTRDANGKPDKFRIAVSPQELLDFQRLYTVTQEIQSDGGFIISIAPKEV